MPATGSRAVTRVLPSQSASAGTFTVRRALPERTSALGRTVGLSRSFRAAARPRGRRGRRAASARRHRDGDLPPERPQRASRFRGARRDRHRGRRAMDDGRPRHRACGAAAGRRCRRDVPARDPALDLAAAGAEDDAAALPAHRRLRDRGKVAAGRQAARDRGRGRWREGTGGDAHAGVPRARDPPAGGCGGDRDRALPRGRGLRDRRRGRLRPRQPREDGRARGVRRRGRHAPARQRRCASARS